MTDNELRKLSRKGLLEILVEQSKEISRLEKENKSLEQQRTAGISYSGVGSLAEEAVKVSNLMEDAQKTAECYLEEIRQMKLRAKQECEEVLARARQEAKAVGGSDMLQLQEKNEKMKSYIDYINAKVRKLLEDYPELAPYFKP